MNKKLSQLLDKLLANSEKKAALKALNLVLNTGIPFNTPHRFKFLKLTERKVQVKLPFLHLNKNHLGGSHACAIATLGEYTAGLSIIKSFGPGTYRLIISKLNADYIKQGRGDLIGEVIIEPEEIQRVKSEIKESNQSEITLATNIVNENEEVVAVIQTTWQLKDWDKVTFKG